VQGQIELDGKIYETNNEASYKRSYLPLQTGNLKGRVNSIIKEVEFEVKISDIASTNGGIMNITLVVTLITRTQYLQESYLTSFSNTSVRILATR
jgi:hypothetical protein